MLVHTEKESPRAELARELNAVYGLLEFAHARCYPRSLTDRLQALRTSYETALRAAEDETKTCAGRR
jgi:hypothetical protein